MQKNEGVNITLPDMQNTETKLTWLGILFTMVGLVTTIYYNAHTLKVTRMESEMSCYLHLNDRYHQLMHTLIHNKTFRHTTAEDLGDEKYILYELFDLFATIKTMESYFTEIAPQLRADWQRKIDFLFSKPAVQAAWKARRDYSDKIYDPAFIAYVQKEC